MTVGRIANTVMHVRIRPWEGGGGCLGGQLVKRATLDFGSAHDFRATWGSALGESTGDSLCPPSLPPCTHELSLSYI